MTGFNLTDTTQWQSMPVLRNDEAPGNTIAESFFHHLRHSRRRLAGANDNQLACDAKRLPSYGKDIAGYMKVVVDAGFRTGSVQGRFPDLAGATSELNEIHACIIAHRDQMASRQAA